MVPFDPKVGSREPFGLKRAIAMFLAPPCTAVKPTATILPSGWIATEFATLKSGENCATAKPAVPKCLSMRPSARNLTREKPPMEFATSAVTPPTMIRPSDWILTSLTGYVVWGKSWNPLRPKVESREPGAALARTGMPARHNATDSETKALIDFMQT